MNYLTNKFKCNNKKSVEILTSNNNITLSEQAYITSLNNNILNLNSRINYLQSIIEDYKNKYEDYKNKYEDYKNKYEDYKNKYEDLKIIENLSEYYICNICLVNPKNIIFMPCGHFISCIECMHNACNNILNSLNTEQDTEPRFKCPICRLTVEYYKQIYS